MILFRSCITTGRVLRLINNCINEMLEFELSFYNDESELQEFVENYFPEYLCRENPQKCMNVLIELKEWTLDFYLHELTCLHEYALFKIFNSYFESFEDAEEHIQKNERNVFKFNIENIEEYTEEEKSVIKLLNNRDFYEENLFEDWDFLSIDNIIFLYQTESPQFKKIGVDLSYYLEIMPKDIRKKVEESFTIQVNKDEEMIIKRIKSAIKLRERYPTRLYEMSEDELNDDIKDMLCIQFEEMGCIIEREARGGYSNKNVGENDFYIYKIENGSIYELALGESKIWNNFEKQVKQLIGYMNENIMFGFTITFNKTQELNKVKEKQIEILEKMKSNKKLNIKSIMLDNDIIISIHINPENNKEYRIYHLIANAYHPDRKKIATESRRTKNKY